MIVTVDMAGDPAVVKWLSAYESTHFKKYALKYFLDFLHSKPGFEGITPSGLIEFQLRAEREGRKYVLLDLLEEHIQSCGGTYRGLMSRWDAVRSFFRRNRAALPEDDFNLKPTREPTQGRLSLKVIKSLVSVSDFSMKPFYLTLFMGILDLERFSLFNRKCGVAPTEHLKTKGVDEPFMIEYHGRKQSKNKTRFYTFIGRDALVAWREYFERVRGYPKDGEAILPDRNCKAIAKRAAFYRHQRLLQKLKYIKMGGQSANRYGYNPHEFCDVARTLLHLQRKKDGLDLQAVEFWMGHVTDPNHYDKFHMDKEYVLEQYRIAEKYLNIVSGTERSSLSEEMKRRDEQIKQLAQKFEEATRRLEGLERKLKEES